MKIEHRFIHVTPRSFHAEILCALKQKQMKVMPWLVELRPKTSNEVIMASKEGGNVTFRPCSR